MTKNFYKVTYEKTVNDEITYFTSYKKATDFIKAQGEIKGYSYQLPNYRTVFDCHNDWSGNTPTLEEVKKYGNKLRINMKDKNLNHFSIEICSFED